MNIVVLLDNRKRNVKIKSGDIVITNNSSQSFSNNLCIYVDDNSVWNHPKPKQLTNDFFQIIPKEFHVFKNSIYGTLFIPLYAILSIIDEVLSRNKINEIHLYGGNDFVFYSSHKSESEGDKWWYRTSWLVNPIIYKLYNEKIKVRWNKKSHGLFLLFYFRQSILLARLLAKAFVSSVTLLIKRNNKDIPTNTDCICFTYLPLQYEKLKKIVMATKYKEVEFITSFNSCASHEGHIKHIYYSLLLPDLIYFYRGFFKKIKNLPANNFFSINEIKLNVKKSFIRQSFIFLYIEFYAELRNIERFARNIEKADVLTNFTYGLDIVMIREFCRASKRKHYNFQVVAMAKMDFPDIELADRYFLLNDDITSYYKSKSLCYSQYLPPYLEFPKKVNLNRLTIGLFLQPDNFAERYFVLCKSLINRIKNLGVKLVIKPHYRQNQLTRFEEFGNNYDITILSKDMLLEKAFEIVDVAISISSSIFFDAFLKGVMGIAILEEEAEREVVISSNIVLNEVNYIVKSMDELMHILSDYENYHNAYVNRRKTWLDKHDEYLISNLQL